MSDYDKSVLGFKARLKPRALEDGEVVAGRWLVGRPIGGNSGRRSLYGGTLFVTNRRLLFEPLRTDLASPPHTYGVFSAIKVALRLQRRAIPLTEIEAVEALPEVGAPRIRLTMHDGKHRDFSFFKAMWDPTSGDMTKNIALRDEALSQINSALTAAGKPG